jgi:hypothetical protein
MKIQIRSGLTALSLAVLAAFALAPAAEAKVYKLHLELTGKAETPPNASKGKGHGSVTYDDQSNDLSWDITWSGLSGDATAAHFHGPAKPGASAPPVVPIKDTSLASPLIGSTTITAEQGKDLLAGKWYFNVHTAANAGGELRGQVLKGGDAKPKAKAEAPASGDAAPAADKPADEKKPAKAKKAKKADAPAAAPQ